MTANQIRYQQHLEEQRSNLAREAETERSNRASEEQKRLELQENSRHNLVVEGEAARSNLAKEYENQRAHSASEALQSYSIGTNAQIAYSNLAETSRANLAREAETNRANVAKEQQAMYDTSRTLANQVLITKMKEAGAKARADQQAKVTLRGQQVQGTSAIVNALARFTGGAINAITKR